MTQHTHTTVSGAQIEIQHTRQELLKFLAAERVEKEAATQQHDALSGVKTPASADSGFNWTSLLGVGVASWWHEHPARSAVLLIESATAEYARRKPLQVVTVAAAVGAAVVLLRPWRMVSATALFLTLLRSSNFTGMASSALDSAAQSLRKERR